MTLIVIFSTIVFFLLGYHVMSTIDKCIDNNVQQTKGYFFDEGIYDIEAIQKKILIFGDNKITHLISDYCEDQDYLYEVIEDINNIHNDCRYISLFALSNNDSDNLIIGSIGLKVYSIPYIITLCNSWENLKIYNEFNFDKVILYDDNIDDIYNVIKELVEIAVKI